jgi:hypothetical protein
MGQSPPAPSPSKTAALRFRTSAHWRNGSKRSCVAIVWRVRVCSMEKPLIIQRDERETGTFSQGDDHAFARSIW